MFVKEFSDSIKEGRDANIFGFDDYPIVIADRLTDARLAIDEVVVDRARAELHIVINTGARAEVAKCAEIYQGHYGEASGRLAKYQRGQLGGFFTHLYDAIAHADPGNLNRLRSAFPDDVAAWENWQANPDTVLLNVGDDPDGAIIEHALQPRCEVCGSRLLSEVEPNA